MPTDEVESAKAAGLRYSIPNGQSIRRRRSGSGFVHLDANGKTIRDKPTLERIRSLVIPPAWTSVWINAHANAHIQAVGRDARGRKQYRYHADYRRVRDEMKFDRMRAFGNALGHMRTTLRRDLNRTGMPKRKVLAAVVKLLETTYIRVGNEEYAEENGSFGLTTLRNRHVEVFGEMLKFRFRGKSGQRHEITVEDLRLARILRRCKDIPGSALFQYVDEEGQAQSIESGDVNEYIRAIGGDFTAKDFRTWGGTCLAVSFLLTECCGSGSKNKQSKSALVEVVKDVAAKLGNKPATCKKYYIHPNVLECYASGRLRKIAKTFRHGHRSYDYERLVLALLPAVNKKLAA
jgi:DNA topoisomerase I